MSAAIDVGKLKFTIFGSGFEDDRANSGPGDKGDIDKYALGITSAVIDSTGDYIWMCARGNGVFPVGLHKYDFENWTEVAHSIPTTSSAYQCIVHPTNVANNYGVYIQGTDWTVFDLTDETVIISGSDPNLPFVTYSNERDCVLNGDHIYIASAIQTRTVQTVWDIDIVNGTFTETTAFNGDCSCGFFDDSNLYGYYPPVWFYQDKKYYSNTISGSHNWTVTSPSDGTPNVSMSGFGRNGLIYLPSKLYGSWRMGAYVGNVAPDLVTPKPLTYFGKFTAEPFITSHGFTTERTKCAFSSDLGVYVTDFDELIKIDSADLKILCLDSTRVVCSDSNFSNIIIYTLE